MEKNVKIDSMVKLYFLKDGKWQFYNEFATIESARKYAQDNPQHIEYSIRILDLVSNAS